MSSDITKSRLIKWLSVKDQALASRALHIRDETSKWLLHIVGLFPHYPSHGIDHSDRIIEQLSRLLFSEARPVVKFSTAEVYCLLCSAYLHDIGMVVSPSDELEILASDDWRSFVSEGGAGNAEYERYIPLRDMAARDRSDVSGFLSSRVLNHLIADFVRRNHHERGRATLGLHPYLRQLVDDGDTVAFETIASISSGHGASTSELADESRFPEERDVFDGKVNVRFLARLLRIGDLLDLSSRRADPMTARAVGPLPMTSKPHWQQYSAKRHENITPSVIEFKFECADQQTHRVLRDWFAWLEAEVQATGLEQLHASRHGSWKMPRCMVASKATTDAPLGRRKPTIVVAPRAQARYEFHDWRLELDSEKVLERLIFDVYQNPTVFVRELIQNALDATRCQLYADYSARNPGVTAPDRPSRFAAEIRELYPVKISLADEDVRLSPDSPSERRPVFTIEDSGTGMSEEIIRRYFLQVGRSYYQSNEFRARFKFSPTSRFGVGFLSVFAVSKDITVDTLRRSESTGRLEGIRLRLTEPRNYLLTEPLLASEMGREPEKSGTRIRVVLNAWQAENSLAEIVRTWCVALEVPMIVTDRGTVSEIRHERLVDGLVVAPGRVDRNARFVLRAFDIDSHGVEGQVGIVAYEDELGEGWCDCWPQKRGLDGRRIDDPGTRDVGYTALHGIRLEGPPVSPRFGRSQWVQYCDVRTGAAAATMARSGGHRPGGGTGRWDRLDGAVAGPNPAGSAVREAAQRAIQKHLDASPRVAAPEGAYYVGSVLSAAPVNDAWRDIIPGTVVSWCRGKREDLSVAELLALDGIVIPAWSIPGYLRRKSPPPPNDTQERSFSKSRSLVSLTRLSSAMTGYCASLGIWHWWGRSPWMTFGCCISRSARGTRVSSARTRRASRGLLRCGFPTVQVYIARF